MQKYSYKCFIYESIFYVHVKNIYVNIFYMYIRNIYICTYISRFVFFFFQSCFGSSNSFAFSYDF